MQNTTNTVRIVKPPKLVSGFVAEAPEPTLPELQFLGEQWAPEDYAISRHSHSVWEFYLQLEGWSVWADARGRSFRCEAGVFFAPPPGLEHWLAQASAGKHYFLFAAIDVMALVHPRWPDVAELWNTDHVVHERRGWACEPAFRALVREATTERPFRAARLRLALESLVLEASRLRAESADGPGRSLLAANPAVESARLALEANPGRPWTVAQLARRVGLSPSHLASCFRQEFGLGPHGYLTRVRIERAKQLLRESDQPVTELAHDLGFHSSQHFARTFRALVGRTASAYRAGG